VHGFAWLESAVFKKTLLLISEGLAYRFADCLITASIWLARAMTHYFKRVKRIYVVENSTTYLFKQVVERLKGVEISKLRALIRKLFGLYLHPYVE